MFEFTDLLSALVVCLAALLTAAVYLVYQMVPASLGNRRSFRRNLAAAIKLEHVGYGLAVAGALLALVAFLGAVFIPVSTVALVYWEVIALIAVILLVIGVVVHSSE